jgi:peptidoglycan hydrolase-like protein with peptidoglycan-binding domain
MRACGGKRVDFRSYPRLAPGSRGNRVTALQCLLRTNARYKGKLDGRLDRDVVRAVRRFQRRTDLRATGKPDAATWTALFARGSSPLMKVGSSGKSALRLERALRAAGQLSSSSTGIVTDRTAKAVARYQRRVGFDPTGVVTTETWAALQTGAR